MNQLATTQELLAQLGHLDIKLRVEDDRLRYDAPKGALTAELRLQLRERKAEIMDFLRSHDNPGSSFELNPVSRDRDLPLSLTQERMWLRHISNPNYIGNSNTTFSFRLTGTLDVTALKESFNQMIRRHEILRTTFPVVNDSPVQAVSPTSTVNMSILDWSDLPQKEHVDELERLAQQEIQERPFDLAKGPLLRVTLVRLGPESHQLLFSMHHILVDAWSIGIFFKELSMFYEAFVSGKPASTPDLPLQYADYAYWQRQSVTPEALQASLNYWKQWLAEEAPLLELPTDKPRPEVESFRAKAIWFQFSPELTQKLKTLTQRAETTLYTTIQAALVTWLYGYSGHEKITIAAPFANRTHWKIEALIGQFNRLLVLRIDIGGNPTFLELQPRVREVVAETIEHQQVPFEGAVKTLQPEPKGGNLPYRAFMSFLSSAPGKLNLPGLTVTSSQNKDVMLRPDVALMIWEEKGPEPFLKGWWEYRTELFEEATFVRMMEKFQILLEAIVANPEQSVDEFAQLCIG